MVQARVVGVDVGGTKTRIEARLNSGEPRTSLTPTRDWRPVEQQRDATRLIRLLSSVADLTADTAVALGVHGCDTRDQCREFAAALSDVSPATFLVVNDAELLAPAAGVSPGVGVVLGTGSIVVAQDAAGGLITAGGWGWLFGDPGSAPALVRDSVAALAAASDGGAVHDPLRGALLDAFHAGSERDLVYGLTEHADIHHWAEAAPTVFAAADAGSALARGVVDRHAAQLLAEVRSVFDKGAVGDTVVIGGGVADGQPAFARSLAARIRAELPAPAVVFDGAPVAGALALAEDVFARRRPATSSDTSKQRALRN